MEIPKAHAIFAGRRQQSPVRAKVRPCGSDLVGGASQNLAYSAARSHFPKLDLGAGYSKSQSLIIRRELGRVVENASFLAKQLPPGHGIPEPERSIPASTGQQVATVVKSDLGHIGLVTLQDRLLLAGKGIPDKNADIRNGGQ